MHLDILLRITRRGVWGGGAPQDSLSREIFLLLMNGASNRVTSVLTESQTKFIQTCSLSLSSSLQCRASTAHRCPVHPRDPLDLFRSSLDPQGTPFYPETISTRRPMTMRWTSPQPPQSPGIGEDPGAQTLQLHQEPTDVCMKLSPKKTPPHGLALTADWDISVSL